jgi:thioredoxin 1
MSDKGFILEYSEQSPSLEIIESLSGDVILEFGAPWCGHCQAAMPFVKQVLNKKAIQHIKVLDGKGKRLGRQFKVKLWPTLILLKDGKEVDRRVRPTSIEEITSLFTAKAR